VAGLKPSALTVYDTAHRARDCVLQCRRGGGDCSDLGKATTSLRARANWNRRIADITTWVTLA
jgi:hypothetical protein